MYNLIENMPEDDRPREKLQQKGAENLQNSELLAILINTGSLGISTLDLSRELLKKYNNSLEELSRTSIAELQKTHGIGKAKATTLLASFELAKRFHSTTISQINFLNQPELVASHLYPLMAYENQEVFYLLHLGTKNNLLRSELVTKGLLDRTYIDPREIFRRAIRESAAKIIVAHNHPTGELTPSQEDRSFTNRLIESGNIIGIPIVDHIIIGNAIKKSAPSYYSFAEKGFFTKKLN